ncbi:MAG: cytochrome c oxidase assembly protein [Nocardioides sp.]
MTARAGVATGLLGGTLGLILLLTLGGGAPVPAPPGLPDPGALTGWALPFLGYGAIMLAVAVVGALLVPLLCATVPGEEMAGRARRAVRAVRPIAAWWLLAVLLELGFTYSDQLAIPIAEARLRDVWAFAWGSDQGRALLAEAGLIALVVVASRWVLTVKESGNLLTVALAALVPGLVTGHAASAGSHDTAVVALIAHVIAATLWLGGLVALWWHLGDSPGQQVTASRRFARVAEWCLAVTAVSGAASALIRLGSVEALFGSGYGWGVLAKVALLAIVAVLAAGARRAVMERSGALTALAGLELFVLTLAVSLGAGLSRTPPPVGEPYTSAAEQLVGGPIPPPPSMREFLFSFTSSGIGLAVIGLGGAAYLAYMLTVRRADATWSAPRAAAWFAGLALVGYATLGGLGTYSHVLFSAHLGSHLVLATAAPLLMVVGAPRQWLAAALDSAPIRFLTRPVLATVLYAMSWYAGYLTGLFPILMENHLGHAFMELIFLTTGLLWFGVILGAAPSPRRLDRAARAGLVLTAMLSLAGLGLVFRSSEKVIGLDYYRVLDRGYATDLLADQHLAGTLTWVGGALGLVLLVVLTFPRALDRS